VGLPDIPITFMTVRRRPIAGQITAAGVRRLDGLVLFVGTKRTDIDPVIHVRSNRVYSNSVPAKNMALNGYQVYTRTAMIWTSTKDLTF
jgi:hypothetical protein